MKGLDSGWQLTLCHTVFVCGYGQKSETLACFAGESLCLQCGGNLLDDLPVGVLGRQGSLEGLAFVVVVMYWGVLIQTEHEIQNQHYQVAVVNIAWHILHELWLASSVDHVKQLQHWYFPRALWCFD